ncbi:MAG TPA: S41 family peptidase [Pyrinomonadaceae bacterium]|nr:S41 family peptidase [Pyrinomonadaceae bacterium]
MMREAKQDMSYHLFISNRSRQALIAAVLLALFLSPSYSSPDSSPARAGGNGSTLVSTETREGRLAVFDDVWATINERYYDAQFHGVDWETQKTNFRGLAAEAGTSRELYVVLKRMIASLGDSHTRIYPPEEKFDWWRPRFVTIGVTLKEIEGRAVVGQVQKGSAAQRGGLRAGDLIESINGQSATALVKSKLANASASGLLSTSATTSRFRAFASLLDGPAGSSVEIRWLGKNGKERTAHFRRDWQQRELELRTRRESGYVVIEIDAFTKPIAAAFTRALKEKVSGVRGVILDLRSNGGGDTEAMTDMASAVVGAGSSLGQFTERSRFSFTLFTRSKSALTPERIAATNLPMVVLTSERTASAAEIFVAAMKASGRASVIGAETCGCVLAIRTRHALPDGGLLDVSELDYRTAAGIRLEGRGVKPDEFVQIERSDLYSGRDRALERAINKMKTRMMTLAPTFETGGADLANSIILFSVSA